MMPKRKERSLQELYNVTDQISGPEITPVLKGSFRIQGPVDELDRDNRRSNEAPSAKKKIRKGPMNDDLRIRAKSGTCNVCAAPCSSCMHFGRTVSAMESKIEDERSGEICKGTEANYCSSSDADVLPLFKSRACDDRQRTASETSNLLSANSSHDSFSENAVSKATMKTSHTTAEVFEDVEMLSKSSSGRAIEDDELHARQCNFAVQGVLVTPHEGNSLDMGQMTLRQYEEQQGLECHDDNISCVTGVKDSNVLVSDHKVDSDRKNVSYSSALASNFPAEGFEKAVQHQTAPDFLTDCQCEIEASQRSSRRLSTCTKHSFRQRSSGITSGSAGFSHKPDPSEPSSSNDFNVRNITPKLHLPCPHSQSSNSFVGLGDSKGSEENSSSQPQEGPFTECSMEHGESSLAGPVTTNSVDGHKFAALDSGSILPNTGDSKASLIRNNSSFGALKKVHPCQETDIDVECGKPPEISVESLGLNQLFEKSSASLEATDTQNHPLQSQHISEIEHSASDIVGEDIKVCDICGDTGREEMLVTCSRCGDGAEHIYCMRVMLDKVPESDWLCEECQLKEDAEKQKLDKTEAVSETPKAPLLDEKELLPNLKNKAHEAEANQAIEAIATPKVSSKRPADYLEVALNSNKEAVETRVGSPGTAGSSKKAALSRESSFKKLNVGKIKPAHPVPSSGSHSANSPQETAHSLTASGPYASWMKARLQPTRGSLSRSATLNNSKPKVKQITVDVSRKQKLPREFANGGIRKEGSLQTFNKSLSFKGTIPGPSNTNESKDKLMSPITSHSEISRGLKQGKEQTIIERKKSFSRYPGVNSSLIADGSDGVKKQSSFVSSGSIIPSSNGMCFSEEQQCKVGPKKDKTASSSWADDESCGSPDILGQDGLPQIQESMNQDGKTKDPSSLSGCKQNVASGGKNIQCQLCKETGHVSQFCTASATAKASTARSMREMSTKSNKWRDVVAAAMSNATIHKINKFPDQVDELSMPSSSKCLRNLATPARRSRLEFQQTHAELNAVPPVSDDSKLKPYMISMPVQASILSNPSRVSAIPERDYIWQGGFEVHRSGRLTDLCDGIQAHLSTCASPKVLEVVNKFSHKVLLEEVSRLSAWPMQFQGNCVTEDNIALYFFAKDLESYDRNYKKLLENMLKNDLALKGNFDGIEILIFASNCLPEKSQRWNRLFFLWAVFRGKRINCSASTSDSQKKLCGATVDVEPFDQDRSASVKAEVTISQKISVHGDMAEELSTHNRLLKELDASKSNIVDFSPLSSSARADWNCYKKASSLDNRSKISHEFNKSSSGGILSTEKHTSNSFPEIYTSASVSQMTALPGTCSLSRTMSNDAQLCSEMKSSSTSVKEVFRDSRNGMVTEHQPYVPATNVESGLDKGVPMYSNTSNCRQEGLTTSSPDRQDASSDSSKIFPASPSLVREASLTGSRGREETDLDKQRFLEIQVEPITKEYNSRELRSSWKHPYANSSDTASEASVETSMKTWRKNTDCVPVGENEYKKVKFTSDSSSQERILGDRFSSKMCYLHPSFQNKEQEDAHVYDDKLKTTERHFFPVDPGPVRDLKSGNTIPWKILSSDDEKPQESDSPNLELALGAEKKPLKQVALPLFMQLEDERSHQNKLLDQATGADDASVSLSLSLALSFSGKEQGAKSVSNSMTESVLPKGHHVNTSLLLFGGLTDS